jgi:hypothetical protein
MSVIAEIQTAGWHLARGLRSAIDSKQKGLRFAVNRDLVVVLAFALVGLLLSVLFPLSAETASQLGQML